MSERITLTILGGGQEIGANCYLLEWGDYRIVLDSGLNIAKQGFEALPLFDLLQNQGVDCAIISHSHVDHVGSLPILVNSFFPESTGIFVTPPSKELIPIMLMDSAKKQENLRIPDDRSFQWTLDRISVTELLTYDGLFESRDFFKKFELVPGLQAYFFPAGHILGAAGVVITDFESTFVYTGDICGHEQTIHKACQLPDVESVDFLLIESTRGSIEAPPDNRQREYLRLAGEIRATLDRGGHVLIPGFALGKSQDLFITILQMKLEGLIPPAVPVFYHKGLTWFINRKYSRFTRYLQGLKPQDLEQAAIRINAFGDDDHFKRIRQLTNVPSIFVFTSGMVSRGSPSARLAEEIVQSEKNSLLFTSYLAPEEFGYELFNVETGGEVQPHLKNPYPITVRCPHRMRFSLSSHSERAELLDIADHFDPDLAIWVHGEPESTEWLCDRWNERNPSKKALRPVNGETLELRS
jgi:cleavage and polyadenylation specificity factor subunit 3